MIYVAMTVGYWGIGETVVDAKAAARKVGSKERMNGKGWLVKRLPVGAKDVSVDEMGTIHWEWAPGADHDGRVEVVERPTAKGRY